MNRFKMFALLALSVTACKTSSDHGVQDEQQNVIGLSVEGAAMSKGAVVDLSTLEADPNGFQVYAYKADDAQNTALIDNVPYKKSATTDLWGWDIATKPIWPEESSAYPIRFYSVYSPHSGAVTSPLTRTLIRDIEFDTKATGNGTNEILVATHSVSSLPEFADPIPMTFNHVLSRVRFAITTGTGVTAKIQSVRLVNVASKRKYDMTTSQYKSVATIPTDFNYSTVANIRTVSGVDALLSADDNGALFMIPQSTTPWSVPSVWDPASLTTGARVEMTYRLFVGSTGSVGYKDMVGYENLASTGEVFATVSYPLDLVAIPWSAGNAYRCTIKLGTGQDNGGILVSDKFIDPAGLPTAETVTNPDTGAPIDNGTPVLGAIDTPIGFGVTYEAFSNTSEDIDQDDAISSIVLTPDTDWLNLGPATQSREITITGADWTTSVFGTGLTVNPSSGVSGTKATLTWAANTFPSERTARVRFIATANGFGATLLRSSQRGTFGLVPAGDWTGVSALGATRTVRVMGSAWTAVATGDGLSIDKNSGANGDELTITLAKHYGSPKPADRTGTVVITDAGGDTQTITTTQLGGIFTFAPAGDWLDVSSDGATLELTVTGAPTWTVALESIGGVLSLSKTSGKDGDKITLTWPSNVGFVAPATRTGKLTFTGSNQLGDIVFNTTQLGGVTPVPTGSFVEINGVKWAVGNLVATSATAGPGGLGALKIGAPTDGGLYFAFGSLIGIRGGSVASGGTGEGEIDVALNNKAWGGTAYTQSKDMLIWPTELTTPPAPNWYTADLASGNANVSYFFSYTKAPYISGAYSIHDFDVSSRGTTLIDGGYAKEGVGDVCRYYLGAPWRLPSRSEISSFNIYINSDEPKRRGTWQTAAPLGAWIGEDASLPTKSIFLPASGYREFGGGFFEIGTQAMAFSSDVIAMKTAATILRNETNAALTGSKPRGYALPARCVYAN